MYSLGVAETILKGVDVKVNFRKSIKPLRDFEGLTVDSFDYVDAPRSMEFWEFPRHPVWLNLNVPASQDTDMALSFSVASLEDGSFCVFVRFHRQYLFNNYSYYEEGVIEDVFKLVISILHKYGDPDEIDKYVELDLKGY